MSIENIRFEDMPRTAKSSGGKPASELVAVRALAPGDAVKFPCRWKHHAYLCNGQLMAYRTARKKGFKVRATCRDGVVYVGRPPEGETT